MKFEVQLERDGDSEMFEDLTHYLKFHPKFARFLFNPAGLTFAIGTLLFLGMLIGWGAILLLDPVAAGQMMATLAAEVFPGKEVATALGIGFGLHPLIVFGIVFVQDLITTSWVYPLFYIFRKRQADKDNFFGYLFTKIERGAKEKEAFIRTWGVWGLFVFMLIPFAVNGPLIGAILGKLVGIRTRYILPALVGATALSTAYWVFLWYYFNEAMQGFVAGPYGTWVQAAFLVAFAAFVVWTVQGFLRDRRTFRRVKAHREALARRAHHTQTLIAADAPEPADAGDRS